VSQTAWLQNCIVDRGEPLSILANVLIALEATLPLAFAYDEMLRASILMEPLKPEAGFSSRPVRDIDVGLVQEKLQHLGLKRISKDTSSIRPWTYAPTTAASIPFGIT
jgi:hypothetical protein